MSRVKYSRRECLAKTELNITEIATLFRISRSKATRVYKIAEKLDIQDYEYRIDDTRVKTSTACKVTGVTLKQLRMQVAIEEEQERERKELEHS